MGNIPLEYQLVIDELVEFWQNHNEPCKLMEHAHSTFRLGCDSLTFFFLTVRDDLRIDKRSKYAASSALEFRQLLEVEYRRLYEQYTKRQQAGKEMAKATTWAEPVELGRKRKKYENVCWNCGSHISSDVLKRCSYCGWFICGNCGSCDPDCNKTNKSVVHEEAGDPFLPDFPDE